MALSRILIVKLSSLGDVVHALPVATALRRRFPAARITWLVGPAAAGVVSMCPSIDRVMVWQPRRRRRLDMVSELRATRPQLSLDLQGLARSAALAWLSGARWRVGYRTPQEAGAALCNLPIIPARTDIHAVDAYLEFARRAGAEVAPVDFGMNPPAAARDFAGGMVPAEEAPHTVALLPGTRWETKQWPARHFAALARGIAESGRRVVVLGGGDDRAAGALITAAAGSAARDLTGETSLAQTAAVLTRCALAVGNDSGPLHLAAALGAPVIALFGPTDVVRTGPYGAGHTVITAPVPCRGCRKRQCSVPCMQTITPERVLEAVKRRLAEDRT